MNGRYLGIERVEVEPRRHLHAHVERDRDDGRRGVEELDVRHVELRRHGRPPEPAGRALNVTFFFRHYFRA